MDWHEHIHSDPAIRGGRPVIRGTRIAVDFLLQLLADGWTEEHILEDYPHLTRDQLHAAWRFSADQVRGQSSAA